MVLKRIRKTNKDLCGDFCDLAGKSRNHTSAWILAFILDIIIPIALIAVGISLTIVGFLLFFAFSIFGLLIVGIVGVIVLLITIVAIIIVSYLLFRQIGIFIIIPIGMTIFIILLGLIPFMGIITFILSLVMWNVVAVLTHWYVYRKDGKILGII